MNNARPGYDLIGLALSATDELSGIGGVLISNETGFLDAQWEDYSSVKNWWVPDMGNTTVFVKYRDRAGNPLPGGLRIQCSCGGPSRHYSRTVRDPPEPGKWVKPKTGVKRASGTLLQI